MANLDLTRSGNNYQKRGVSVMVSESITGAQISTAGTDGITIGTLPEKSMIVDVTVLTTTVSTDVSDTLDVNYNASEVVSELVVGAVGAWSASYGDFLQEEKMYSATGGDIMIEEGDDALASDWVGRVIVEYIELDKWTGEYTEVTQS